MPFLFPRVYPILDSSFIPSVGRLAFLQNLGKSLAAAGVTLLEYRNKTGARRELLEDAAVLRSAMSVCQVKLILDDRVDLIEQIGFDGVHVDNGDLSPSEARRLVGPNRIVGTFGGSQALVPEILQAPTDYFSIGPVFATRTKQTSTPPIGIEGVKRLRDVTGVEPVLVAVGGITLATASAVLDAGATVLAVAGGIFRQEDPVAEFRKWMDLLG